MTLTVSAPPVNKSAAGSPLEWTRSLPSDWWQNWWRFCGLFAPSGRVRAPAWLSVTLSCVPWRQKSPVWELLWRPCKSAEAWVDIKEFLFFFFSFLFFVVRAREVWDFMNNPNQSSSSSSSARTCCRQQFTLAKITHGCQQVQATGWCPTWSTQPQHQIGMKHIDWLLRIKMFFKKKKYISKYAKKQPFRLG